MISDFVSLVSHWSGGLDERWQAVITFLLEISLLLVGAFAKPVALAIPLLRRILSPDDRYAGTYLQVIDAEGIRRYSVFKVSYYSRLRSYCLRGFQYNELGVRSADFESDRFLIRKAMTDYIEFMWTSVSVSDKEQFAGYTQMRPDETDNFQTLAGSGFFITFHQHPRRFELKFYRLSSHRLQKWQVSLPTTEEERSRFVATIHKYPEMHQQVVGAAAIPLI